MAKFDLSSPWVQQLPDLANINKAIPIRNFETRFVAKNCDFEFKILERVTCTNRHLENIMRPEKKQQQRNRYYHIRLFVHAAVPIYQFQSRNSDFDEEILTNAFLQSEILNKDRHLDSKRTMSDTSHQFEVENAKKRFSNGLSDYFKPKDLTATSEKVHKHYGSYSLPEKLRNDSAKKGTSGFYGSPSHFDLIEEQVEESSPMQPKSVINHFPDLLEPKYIEPKEALFPQDKTNFGKLAWPEPQSKEEGSPSPDTIDFPINLEKQSDSNQSSLLSENSYINASFIHHPFLASEERPVIVTQLPLHGTICDFWQMVWEYNVTDIVMLCAFCEDESEKHKRYIPKGANQQRFGRFIVSVQKKAKEPFLVTRSVALKDPVSGKTINIKHYKIKVWPDKENLRAEDYPKMSDFLVNLIKDRQRRAETTADALSPVIIHCKAGIGRSGVFCAFYFICEYIMALESAVEADASVLDSAYARLSIFATVRKIRECRWGLIQSPKQYFNVYDFANHLVQTLILRSK